MDSTLLQQEGKITDTLYGWMLFAICFISGVFGGVTSTLMSVYLPVAVSDLLPGADKGQLDHIGAVINAVFILGWMFGGFCWGYLCDKAGRKWSVILSTACIGVFTLGTAFAPGWTWVAVCRFFSGFGVGGVLVTTAVLIAETWNEKNRAIALGILSITIPVGIFSTGVIEYFVTDWRQAFYAGLLPIGLALISMKVIKESASWEKTKDTYLQNENRHSLFSSDIRKDLILACLIFGTMLIGLWAVLAWLPTWVQSLVTGTDAQHERGISMMLFAAGGLTGGLISGWITNAIGVRKCMLICFAGCFILSYFLFKMQTTIGMPAYAGMVVIALFIGISQGALTVYIPELFPVEVRGAATGFCFNVGRLFTATAVFFVGSWAIMLGGYGQAIFCFSFVFLAGFFLTLFSADSKVKSSTAA